MLDKDRRSIQTMFAKIAHRYDRANHLLSMQVDHWWRRFVATRLLSSPGRVLDLAAGTGDLTVALTKHGKHRVTAADFTFEMLAAGQAKVREHANGAPQITADALALPLRSGSFDGVTISFGIRNFADASAGLRESHRVLKSGGRLGVLEFSHPRGIFGAVFRIYSFHIIPFLGGLITGHREPYEYLPKSVRTFPEGNEFLELMRSAGFEDLRQYRLTGGIATFYMGSKK